MADTRVIQHIADSGVPPVVRPPAHLFGDGEPRNLVLFTSSCRTPDCPCLDTDIRVVERSSLRAAHEDEILDRAALVIFEADSKRAKLVSDGGGLLTEGLYAWLETELQGITGELLEARARRLKTRELRRPWRLRSWNDYARGELIPFFEAVPGELDLLVEVEGEVGWARDLYCINPKCDCYEVTIELASPATEEEPTRLRMDLDRGAILAGGGALAEQVSQQLRKTYGIDELRFRYRRMREMGRDVSHELRAATEPPPASAPKTGRNEPCPCGSGKKYKKCCFSSNGARA